MENLTQKAVEKKSINVSIMIPVFFVSTLWLIYFAEYATGIDFSWLGILPRTLSGLSGILFTPFLHGSLGHLLSNSIPLLVLGGGLIYFYRSIAYKVLLWIWFIDGLGVWLLGRDAYHIGASGLVYGIAAFLIFSGLLRRNRNLLALSLAVVFVYGSLIWGMFPYIPDISWEAHLFGFLAGIYFSVHFLGDGPSNDYVPEWMYENEEDETVPQKLSQENDISEETKEQEGSNTSDQQISIRYSYKQKELDKEEGD